MWVQHKRLGEILVENGLITKDQLESAIEQQQANYAPLGQILVERGFIHPDLLLQALAAQQDVTAWHIERDPPTEEAIALVSPELCRKYGVLPVELRGDLLLLAMRNTTDIDAIDAVRGSTKLRIEPVLVDSDKLAKVMDGVHGGDGSIALRKVDNLVQQALDEHGEKYGEVKKQGKQILTEEDTAPVVGLVNQVISDAIRKKVSDVHFEPRAERVEIRFRIDGQLKKVREIPVELAPMVTARIKIMAELDIVEHRLPQDGRFAVTIDGKNVDLRISVLPNYHGPRIVLRVLDRSVGLKRMEELGFSDENLGLFRQLVDKPYGMFLVTGPTGSGKTTTLYAALNDLKDETNNIMTCEDPVEYDLEGINQSQVNEKVGLTFAKQLRAILRQDPDVILVGEIRDKETAETGLRASMTGHMVLSTLHCNDAPSAVPRLLDMGIDPYLLSTSLIGVMGQRLLRVLCKECKSDAQPTQEEREMLLKYFGADNVRSLAHPVGCKHCHGTGYMGRMAVHEILPCTQEIAKLIAERQPVEVIKEIGRFYGYRTMQEDALARVVAGQTSLAEAKRLIFFDSIVRKDSVGSAMTTAA